MSKLRTRFKICGTDRTLSVEGQEARSLNALHDAGPDGITALEMSTWALRLAHYCMKLRKLGLAIETIREPHGGPVKGWHGRYVLKTAVEILETSVAA